MLELITLIMERRDVMEREDGVEDISMDEMIFVARMIEAVDDPIEADSEFEKRLDEVASLDDALVLFSRTQDGSQAQARVEKKMREIYLPH